MNIISTVLKNVHNSISITGTLGNEFVYKALTGLTFLPHNVLKLPSPYDPKNIKVIVVKGVTTEWKKRTRANWQRMNIIIESVLTNNKSNAAIYVPSYTIIEQLRTNGLEVRLKAIGIKIFYAERGMTSAENDELIKEFAEYRGKGGVLCAVIGGRSSEGTDFKGDMLEIVFTVGIPYVPQNLEIEKRIRYFDEIFPGYGWEISYGSPAWQKLMQCAGRPLRSLTDRAFVVMLEERIATSMANKRNGSRIPQWIKNSCEVVEYDQDKIGEMSGQFFND